MSLRPSVYNPTPHVIPEGENATPLGVVGGDCTESEKLIIVMCGLPATGKTHIANRIARYLSFFLDIPAKIFNVGDYRRKLYGSKLPADFFDHSNDEFMSKRLQACDMALKDLTEFMKEDGVRVGVLDSTNSNSKRRAHIRDALKNLECKVVVFESIVDKEEVSFIVTFLLFWGNQLIVISLREPRLLSPTFVTFT
jgi:predicted kinase